MVAFVQRFRRSIAVFFVSLALVFTVQRADAFFDETGAYASAIAAMGAGSTFLATTTGTALAIGSAVLGVAVVAVAIGFVAHKYYISTRTLGDDVNPDLAAAPGLIPPGAQLYAPLINGISYPYLFISYGALNLTPPGPDFYRFFPRFVGQLAALGYSGVRPPATGPGIRSYGYTDSYCPLGGCWYVPVNAGTSPATSASPAPVGTCPAGLVCSTFPGSATTDGVIHIFIPIRPTTGMNCPPESVYDFGTASCMTTPVENTTLATDGACRISWGSTGCPVYNHDDPDCVPSEITATCGTSTVPPKVVVADPASGKTLTVERPALATQGAPGATRIVERTPNAATGTTTERVNTTVPDGHTGQPPLTSGAGQQTYSGTGSGTSATPVSNVAISNWPNGLESVAGYLEIIAGNTAPPAGGAASVKIDGEVPPAYADLPTGTAPDHTTFMSPIKTKLAGFFSFTLPPHTSACPALNLSFHAWGLNIDSSSNFMCEFLDSHQTLLQGLVQFGYIASAIIIVLGA